MARRYYGRRYGGRRYKRYGTGYKRYGRRFNGYRRRKFGVVRAVRKAWRSRPARFTRRTLGGAASGMGIAAFRTAWSLGFAAARFGRTFKG